MQEQRPVHEEEWQEMEKVSGKEDLTDPLVLDPHFLRNIIAQPSPPEKNAWYTAHCEAFFCRQPAASVRSIGFF